MRGDSHPAKRAVGQHGGHQKQKQQRQLGQQAPATGLPDADRGALGKELKSPPHHRTASADHAAMGMSNVVSACQGQPPPLRGRLGNTPSSRAPIPSGGQALDGSWGGLGEGDLFSGGGALTQLTQSRRVGLDILSRCSCLSRGGRHWRRTSRAVAWLVVTFANAQCTATKRWNMIDGECFPSTRSNGWALGRKSKDAARRHGA